MASFFRKLKKLAKKAIKVAPVLAGTAVGGPAGGLVAKIVTAQKAIKGVGAFARAQKAAKLLKGKVPLQMVTKADAAMAQRTAQLTPTGKMVTPTEVKRVAMPGGATNGQGPFRRKFRRFGELTAGEKERIALKAARKARAAPVGREKAAQNRAQRQSVRAAGLRKPPVGGLDLKGLSASWKAAGKPGSWQAWIKANK